MQLPLVRSTLVLVTVLNICGFTLLQLSDAEHVFCLHAGCGILGTGGGGSAYINRLKVQRELDKCLPSLPTGSYCYLMSSQGCIFTRMA